MTTFDQRNQQVETQYNAGHDINYYQQPLTLPEALRKRNRARMLERVRAIWITGVLEKSLHGAAQIALGLQKERSAAINSWRMMLQDIDPTESLLSSNTRIEKIFDRANGEVLILGEPGSGKTTMLLELARELLARAERDETHPIPVVFNLSSWGIKRQPLVTWLVDELSAKYQVPRAQARSWIETDQVLPLLDGLDEVALIHRSACVETINTYRREHGLVPLVVSSRQGDYLALSTRLHLRSAVVVQPLTPQQIDTYLVSAGDQVVALRKALHEDPDLQALVSTPLMLSVLIVAYQGKPVEDLAVKGSYQMRQRQIFEHYIQRMLKRRSAETRYQPQQVIHWLSWLARQMKQQSQTVFYLEQLQPNWLSGTWMPRAYDWLAIRMPGMFIGVLVSLAINILFFDIPAPVDLAEMILLGGLLGGLFSGGSVIWHTAASEGKTSNSLWSRLPLQLGTGALIGLAVGLSHGLPHGESYASLRDPTYAFRHGLTHGASSGWEHGLRYGLIFGICSILLQVLLSESNTVGSTSQAPLTASGTKWQQFIRSIVIRNGLLVGLLTGLSYGLSRGLNYGLPYGVGRGVIYGLIDGLIGGLLSLLLVGRSGKVRLTDRLIWPWRTLLSKRNVSATLQVTALIGLLIGLGVGASVALNYDPRLNGLNFGLTAGLSIGLSIGLLLGLFQGVSSETIEDQRRVVPNQGIRRSARNGLVLGIIIAVILGLSGAISYELSVGLSVSWSAALNTVLSVGLPVALIMGLLTGLLAGLLNGGLAYLRHYVLRFLLWRAGAIPWNYVRFLDFAAERILLSKVGGGYMFVHRLLLEHFAAQETPAVDVSPVANQGITSPVLPSSTSSVPSVQEILPDLPSSTITLVSIHVLPETTSEFSGLLPCGHEPRSNARFCSVCGAPTPSA